VSEIDLGNYVGDGCRKPMSKVYIEDRYWRFTPKTCVEVLCRGSISRSTSKIYVEGLRRRSISEVNIDVLCRKSHSEG
jgi:hypothetical protein